MFLKSLAESKTALSQTFKKVALALAWTLVSGMLWAGNTFAQSTGGTGGTKLEQGLDDFVKKAAKVLQNICGPIALLLFFVAGLMIISGGISERMGKKGAKVLLFLMGGMALVSFASFIVPIAMDLFKQLGGTDVKTPTLTTGN